MNLEKIIQASDFVPFTHTDLNKTYGNYTQYTLEGNLPEGVSLSADGKVTVHGALQEHNKINATGKITLKGNVGEHVALRGQAIESDPAIHVGSYGVFEACDGNLVLPDIGTNNHLTASGYIELLTAGENLHATAKGEVSFNELGDNARVLAAQVSGGSTGEDSDITATKGNVRLSYAGSRSRIFSAEPAQIVSQGSNVTLNDYFEELPVPSISAQDTVHENKIVNSITFDMENNHFIIPRALAPHIDATPFIDAAVDAGCSVKSAPASDALAAAYILVPEEMKTSEFNKLRALATQVNTARSTGVTL